MLFFPKISHNKKSNFEYQKILSPKILASDNTRLDNSPSNELNEDEYSKIKLFLKKSTNYANNTYKVSEITKILDEDNHSSGECSSFMANSYIRDFF